MLKYKGKSLRTVLAVTVIVAVAIFLLYQLIALSTPILPYIATTESERVSVPSSISKIYQDNTATATSVPGTVTVQKISNLRSAISDYKDYFLEEMDEYEEEQLITGLAVEEKTDILGQNDAYLQNIRNGVGVVTATSVSDLNNKINAATDNITVKIATLNLTTNYTFGNLSKSVTLIIGDLQTGTGSKSLTVYGNIIILDNISSNTTTITAKKTSVQTDGNLYIDCEDTLSSMAAFDAENMIYISKDFTLNSAPYVVQSNSFIAGGTITANGYNTGITAADFAYFHKDLSIKQLLTVNCDEFTIAGDLTSEAYDTTFNVAGTFYANESIFIKQRTYINARDLIVCESLSNIVYGTDISVSDLIYIYDQLSITQNMTIGCESLIINGSVLNEAYDTTLDVGSLMFVRDNLEISAKTNIYADRLFVGGNVTGNAYDQVYTVQKEIFFGSYVTTLFTTVNCPYGDLIIEGEFSSTNILVNVGGRVAVGGNIKGSGNSSTFRIDAGGQMTSVLLDENEAPSATSSPTPSPAPSPIEGGLLVKSVSIVPTETENSYLLSVTYKRLAGITEERIMVTDLNGELIKEFIINPQTQGTADGEGYVTFENLSFDTNNADVLIKVDGTTRTIRYEGMDESGGTRPYFVINKSQRKSIPNPTNTIYTDHSAKSTIYSSPVTVSEYKFLKKAVFDYGKYFRRLKKSEEDAFEKNAQIYNNRTVDQLVSIVSGISGNNVIIKTNNLTISKNMTLGSPTKSVTLIVDNITVNSSSSVVIYGNLIVKNNLMANQSLNLTVNKVNGEGGNFYGKDVTINSTSTLTVEGCMYLDSLTLNQGATVTADTVYVKGNLVVNQTTQITAVNDIYVGSLVGNQAVQLTATNGDLIVMRDLTFNSPSTVNVGGRVIVGKRTVLNATSQIAAGGNKTALILPGEEVELIEIVEEDDVELTALNVNLKGGIYPKRSNGIASFGNTQTYFAGDYIYYSAGLPEDGNDVKVSFKLNKEAALELFEPLPGTGNLPLTNQYASGVSPTSNVSAPLQTNANPKSLESGFANAEASSNEYVFKVKLKNYITSPDKVNNIKNSVTINYKAPEGTEVTVQKNFNIIVVPEKVLRMN
ncbi:MAG: hypothetical protein BWY15_00250 [Firmicutes bacterium ADurb.Bin193]|nr:MAG: hypothetical protein BWY15_00250 [Firmicutes bacterium ADurb.Bin193]